jgi:hypothetical protein
MALCMVVCHPTNKLHVYRFSPSVDCDDCSFLELMEKLTEVDSIPKYITIKNDSIIEYSKCYGGIYGNTEIKYEIVNNELITDSVNINGYEISSVTNMRFLYSQDSLINKQTNEKYYNQKYLNKIRKK